MSPAATLSLLSVAHITLSIVAGLPARSEPLRNVIITSFGEMPYEPAEQGGGFYQSDVFPVSLNGNDPPQTMDVALRTGILVEDPNEKQSENDGTDERKSENDDTGSTDDEQTTVNNIKRQATPKKAPRNQPFQIDEEDFLIPRPKVTRDSKVHNSYPVQIVPSRSFGYEFRQTKQQRVPYVPRTDTNGYNINTEYYGDLGEGWDLQDAERVLRGRNYNILGPSLSPRETPPPMTRHFPGFDYSPYLVNRRSGAHWPYPQPVFVSDDYLSGL